MKTIKSIKIWALGLLSLGMLFGCQPKVIETTLSVVAVENRSMTFEATNAEAQVLNVYSDGAWAVECDAEWIEVNPMSGIGSTEVTISVLDNTTVENGKTVIDVPRKATLYVKGGSSDPNQNGSVIIEQKGDTYFGKPILSVEDFIDIEEGTDCKLDNVLVVALADEYFVVSDNTGIVLVKGLGDEVNMGAVLTISGQRIAQNGLPAMAYDGAVASSTGTPSYPEAKDITATIDAYEPAEIEYVSVEGSVVGFAEDKLLADANLRVAGQNKEVVLLNQKSSKELASINYHKVVLEGYSVGLVNGAPALVIVNVKSDGGLDESVIPIVPEAGEIIFKDDFTWLDPIVAAYREQAGADKVGDTVASADKSADAPNIWNIAALSEVFAPAFAAKGYTDLNPEEKLLYLQPGYLKMSKTGGHNTALQLQIGSLPASGVDVDITYEYCMMVQGDGTVDAGPVGVLILGDGEFANGTKLSDGNISKQNKDQFLWNKTAVMKAKGVTSRTKFVFLMHRIVTDEEGKLKVNETTGEPIFKWDVSGAGRVFIDNITIKASGPDVEPVFADITVDEDVLAFEGEGGEKTIKITASEDFTLEASESWISFDKTEGVKDEETEIVVNVAASDLSQLREGTVTITAADSQKTIRIIQSAAGQELDPLISLSSNAKSINYKEQEISVDVQSTVEYTVISDVDWIMLTPETKTLVNKETVTVYVAENASTEESRTGHVRFANEKIGIESVLTITQGAHPDDNVIFSDDFSWLSSFVSNYNSSHDKALSDFIYGTYADLAARIDYSNNNSAALANETELFASAGYERLNTSTPAAYAQGTVENPYLKFCKKNVQDGLSFKPFKKSYEAAKMSLDWAVHMTNSALDVVNLQLQIEGAGTFANGTKVSDPATSNMTEVADPFFTNSSFTLLDVDETTVIKICSKQGFDDNFASSGQHRYYIDNIVIVKSINPVVWNDDFSWLSPFIQAYNDAATEDSKKAADFMNGDYADLTSRLDSGNTYSVGLYGSAFKESFIPERDKHGYTTLKADNSAVYANGTTENPYFKFCKSGKQDGLVFKPFPQECATVVLSLDWGRHMTSTALDAVSLQIRIEGDGEFENGTKNSDPVESEQKEVGEIKWTHSEFVIKGVSENTVIKICSKEAFDGNFTTSGQHRYYIDNLKIEVK